MATSAEDAWRGTFLTEIESQLRLLLGRWHSPQVATAAPPAPRVHSSRNTKPRLNWTNSTLWCLRFYSSGSSVSCRLNWTNSTMRCLRFYSSGSSVSFRLNWTNSILWCVRFYSSALSVSVKLNWTNSTLQCLRIYSSGSSVSVRLNWTNSTLRFYSSGSSCIRYDVVHQMWCDISDMIRCDVMCFC